MNRQFGSDVFCLYKNNSDGKGNSYGYHENYLLSRAIPFDTIVRKLLPFLVTRQIFAGAGKVGAENATDPVAYQIAQRSDFFECLVDLNTMVRRPIINTRDEPHADSSRFRRLHVIVGDANMSEWSTYLKVGTAAIIIQLLEAGADLPTLELDNPVAAIKSISRDWQFKQDIQLAGGKKISAVDIQRQYLHAAHQFFACHELSPATKDILVYWERVLDLLEQDPMQLADELDWVAKRAVILSYMERKRCGWDDPRIKLLDLQYHDIQPDKGVYYTLERSNRIKRLLSDDEIQAAEWHPPVESRAYFRGMCLKKFPQSIYGMSWTSVLLDIGKNVVKRIPLMNPSRGTQALTQDLFDGIETVEQLLDRIGP